MSIASALLRRDLTTTEKSVAVVLIARAVARAFQAKPPRLVGKGWEEKLASFREYSAVMCEGAEGELDALEGRLFEEARRLGSLVRRLLRPSEREGLPLICKLYTAIDIDMSPQGEHGVSVRRCSFSGRYTPNVCRLMSCFDSGFLNGVLDSGTLWFEQRITQGSPVCVAQILNGPVQPLHSEIKE